MKMRRPWSLLIVLLAGALWPVPARSQVVGRAVGEIRFDTLGSIPVTKNLAREPIPAPEAVRPREIFRVGSVSGDEETLFSGPVIGLSNGPNGQLFVLDREASLIRVFGSEGGFVRQFGRPGRGPGDLSPPSALAWAPDGRLWIPEPFARRYSVFDSLGEFVKTVPRPFFRGLNRRVYPAAFQSENVLLDHASFGTGAGFSSVDTTGAVLDSFPPMRYPPNPLAGTFPFGRDEEWIEAVRTFQPDLVWTLAPDRTLWTARTDSLRLVHRTLDGDTLRIVEAMHRPSIFSEAERAIVHRVSRMYEDVDLQPAVIQSLHASDDGLLFVQIAGEMGRPGHEVDVFGQEGEYLGSFSLELPIQPLSQSDFVGRRFSYVGVGPLDVPIIVQTRVGG